MTVLEGQRDPFLEAEHETQVIPSLPPGRNLQACHETHLCLVSGGRRPQRQRVENVLDYAMLCDGGDYLILIKVAYEAWEALQGEREMQRRLAMHM